MSQRTTVVAIAAAITLLMACAALAQSNGSAQLLFHDEFKANHLDAAKWFWCYPNESPANCTNNQSGIPYREEEQYRRSQLVEGGGSLQLVAVRSSVKPSFPWTSGLISTGGPFQSGPPQATFAFKYGYAEIRTRIPSGDGFWPAFWMIPSDGSWPPEIDVMEWQGGTPHRDYMTVHFSDPQSSNDSLQATYDGPDFSQDYHIFAIDWQPGVLIWYVDNVERFRVTAAQIEARGGKLPDTPMYIIANLAIGGWISPPNPRTPSPASMFIDYVRVWNRKP